jgi:glyoxylase-like metal-dependent hydrolase (beta-lactamase superfamily II)
MPRITPARRDFLDVWHGLEAVHLPGHTPGQMGYYCKRLKLLFSADLFATQYGVTRLPPAIFNSEPERIPASVTKALALDLEGVLPNHCGRADPGEQLHRLRKLDERLKRRHGVF